MAIERIERESCLLLRLSRPPVNALDRTLADELVQALAEAGSRRDLRLIVLAGAGRCFCAGADVGDLHADPELPASIRRAIMALDDCPLPVIAAMHGVVYGGGLELAMACHGRVATSDARFAFPEVSLGLLPGAGGTQRATRLLGPQRAQSMMVTGTAIDATRALAWGLIDGVADGDLVDAAIALAQSRPGDLSRARDRPIPDDRASPSEAAGKGGNDKTNPASAEAILCITECVQAATELAFDAGEAVEQRLFAHLLASRASLGLRHAFLGERAVTKLPGSLAQARPQLISKVVIVGAGLMGTGIAQAFLATDYPVTLVDPDAQALARAVRRIADGQVRDVEKGRIDQRTADARQSRLSSSTTLADVRDADLVVEAVYEDMAVKRTVFEQLDAAAKPGAILATNTSTLDVDALASAVRDPDRVLGMHFFSPANIMRLVEIVRGARTAPDAIATAMDVTRKLRKIGVVAGVCDGFIGNRMFEEYLRQAYFLLEEGALPQQIDRAMEAFGFAMGPLRVMDLAGQDIGWSIRKRRAVEQPDRPYSRVPDLICELGRFGQKTGAGYYLYPDGRQPVVDPEIDALILGHSQALGLERRTFDDEEIVKRCLYALINEGARILDEGIAWRPVDVDMIWTAGYGFPKHHGGPMFHGDAIGLQRVLAGIRELEAGRHGWAWKPSELLVRLANAGKTFGDLNG